jgi:Domain of unknown function (DUF4388)
MMGEALERLASLSPHVGCADGDTITQRATARRARRLWLHHGRGVRARIEGSRHARKPAIYELLTWNGGRFAFTQTDVSHIEDEIGAPTPMLLIEADRRTDEQQNEAQASAP